jgi:aminodeoxyfutalosine deaminase
MRRLGADWVIPVDRAPIRDGWVAVDGDHIVALGDAATPDAARLGPLEPLGAVALMPGLVNTHVHLELSWMRGLVPPATGFTKWVRQLFAVRGRATDTAIEPAARHAAEEMRAAGTVAIGDISNSLAVVGVAADAGLRGWVFHEVLGFAATDGARVDETREARRIAAAGQTRFGISIAPHAPYSVSVELFRAVMDEARRLGDAPTSVHLAESPEEVDLIEHGTGPWPGMLRAMGAWRDGWTPPGVSPAAYLDGLGVLGPRTLVVHGVQLSDDDLARLQTREATLVTCPRSNEWVGVGAPPAARFFASGIRVAVGTDSLASVDDLNLFMELAALRRLAPAVPARRILHAATFAGAEALGLDDRLGSLAPGKLADIVAVRLPTLVDDAEEALVTGVTPDRISWACTSRDTISRGV